MSWASDPEPIEKNAIILGQGEQRTLLVPGLIKYSIGKDIIRILPLQTPPLKPTSFQSPLLLIKGIRPGNTDLWIWKTDGSLEFHNIHVEAYHLPKKTSLLQKSVTQLRESEVIFSGSGIILRGEIQHLQELTKIHALIKEFPEHIENHTYCSPQLLESSSLKLNQWLETIHQKNNLRIETIGNHLWLRGFLKNRLEQKSLLLEARALFPPLLFELESLSHAARTIHFKVFILEIKRKHFSHLGLSWPGETPQLFQIMRGSFQSLFQIDLALQKLEGSGNAKLLSSPELVVRAPGEAELFAGGEIPISLQHRFYSNMTWKKYGLTLRLKITETAGNQIRLEIFTEISHLDLSAATDKIPGIQANRMQTHVDAHLDVPLFLSGLFQQSIRKEAKGLPLLQYLPVLGHLFGSEDYLNARSELVVILYPHSTPPSPPPEPLTQSIPSGRLPIPRNWISPIEERELRESKDYPWNAFP